MEKRITGYTQLIGLIAKPIKHSISPMIHNISFSHLGLDYAYLAFEVDEDQVKDAINSIKVLNMRGCNVSMPYKSAVIPYLDHLSPVAKMVGAVNTIVNDHGILTGHITDGTGLLESLKSNGYQIKDKKMVIVGCGGAATAIIVQAAIDGLKQITIYNKKDSFYEKAKEKIAMINEQTNCLVTLKDLNDLEALKQDMHQSDFFINATNVGMGKLENMSYIPDLSYFTPHLFVVDIIYNPKQTLLLKMAKEANCQTMNGLGMLLYQGAEAFKLWTNQTMPIEKVKQELGLEN